MAQWLEQLKCRIHALDYDYDHFIGNLYLVKDNCCDMRGAIELFSSIDPAVSLIQTFEAGEPATVYKKERDKWKACDPIRL